MSAKSKKVKQRGKRGRRKAAKQRASHDLAIYQAQLRQAASTIAAQRQEIEQLAAERDLYQLGHVKPREGMMMTMLAGNVAIKPATEDVQSLEDVVDIAALCSDIGRDVLNSGAVFFGVSDLPNQLSWRCNTQLIPDGLNSWRKALLTTVVPRPWEQ